MFDEKNGDRTKQSGGASYIYGTVAELRSLLSGGWVDLDSAFTVEDLGAHLARVRITHKPDGTESFELELLGAEGREQVSHLDVNMSAIDFGVIPLRSMKEIPVIITNNGSRTIEIKKISKVGKDAAVFSTSGIGTPFKVLPGLMVQVNIHFSPRREGPFAAALRIETTEDDDPDLIITLAAEGRGSVTNKEEDDDETPLFFLSPDPAKVGDILKYVYRGTEQIQCGIVVYDEYSHELFAKYRFDLIPGEHPLPIPLELDGGKYFFRFLLPHTQRILSLVIEGKKKRPRGRPKKKRY